MAKINTQDRVVEYSVEFKLKVVALTEQLEATTVQICDVLGLHPIMVYRWRQECRAGKLVAEPTRTIAMTKQQTPKPITSTEHAELKRLRRDVAALKKENDFLKKWERYLKDQKQSGSAS